MTTAKNLCCRRGFVRIIFFYTMPIIPVRIGNKMVKANIPEDCVKLVAIIQGLNRIQLPPQARQFDKDVFCFHLTGWEDALLWVVKFRKNLRPSDLPLNTKQLKAARPFGKFLYSMFCLAQSVIEVIDTSTELWKIKDGFNLYKNAEEWFWYLCLEQELGEIFAALFPEQSTVSYFVENSEIERRYNKETKNLIGYLQVLPSKEKKKEKMRQELKMLKRLENPYPVDSLDGDLYRLIQLSVEIAPIKIQGKNDSFADAIRTFRCAWKMYIQSYEVLLKKLHSGTSGCKMRHIKNEKLYERISGKHIELIYPEPTTNALRISRQGVIAKL